MTPNKRKTIRAKVLKRDKYTCRYCGRRLVERSLVTGGKYLGGLIYDGTNAATVDHVIPVSKGGGFTEKNLVAACNKCNGEKSDKLLEPEQMPVIQPQAKKARVKKKQCDCCGLSIQDDSEYYDDEGVLYCVPCGADIFDDYSVKPWDRIREVEEGEIEESDKHFSMPECSQCNGFGFFNDPEFAICGNCDGEGRADQISNIE